MVTANGSHGLSCGLGRLVAKVFQGLEDFCEAYLDDIMVFSNSWEAHISQLQQVFPRVRLANLKLNICKCEFANARLDFLLHSLSLNMVQPRQQKVDALLKFPAPPLRNKFNLCWDWLVITGSFCL